MIGFREKSCVLVALGVILAGAPARAEDFYAGKTITLTTHSSPGGQYDSYSRLLARFIGKYIPGNPNVVVVNRVGAGGLLAVNQAGTTAPRDGTFLTLVANGLVLSQGIGQPGLRAALDEFNFIGNFSSANGITIVSTSAGVTNIDDVRRKEVTIGSSGAGSISALLPAAHNAFGGTKFKVVQGYEGSAQMNLAIRRGEIHGRSGGAWSELQAEFPEEVRARSVIPLSQTGPKRDPALPDVPLLTEIARGDERNLAGARFVSEALAQPRSIAAPPGVPQEIVAVLRAAFQKAIADPAFLDEARRSHLEMTPVAGEDVQRSVRSALGTPAAIREYVKTALEANN
jgi:tripartite-type tricarboxylate transporter receptor subunit TctC